MPPAVPQLPPPLPTGGATPPSPALSKVATLLPPGADIDVAAESPRAPLPAIQIAPGDGVAHSGLTAEERAQRRFLKNAIVFGVLVVILFVVFLLMAR
jgi:hypothetical protein